MDVFDPVQAPVGTLLHRRAEMHRVDQLRLRVGFGDMGQGGHDIFHGLSIVLPAVAGDQNHLFPGVIQGVQPILSKGKALRHRGLQGVDHRVAGDKQPVPDALRLQIAAVGLGGAEVQLGQPPHHGAVHLLREGGVAVPGAQPRLHVAHGDLLVKRRQRPGKGGGGVPMDQHQVGPHLLKHLFQPQQALGGDGGQGLAGLHDIQVELGDNAEYVQHRVQHLPVLGGDAAKAFNPLPALQLLHQGGHFDGLRPGAEYGHHLQLIHAHSLPSPPGRGAPAACRGRVPTGTPARRSAPPQPWPVKRSWRAPRRQR